MSTINRNKNINLFFLILRLVGVTLAIYILAIILATSVTNFLHNSTILGDDIHTNYLHFLGYLLVSSTVIFALVMIEKRKIGNLANIWKSLHLKVPNRQDMGYAVGLYAVYFIVTLVVFSLLHIWVDVSPSQSISFDNNYPGWQLAFLALVILVPLYEELLLRGFLYRRLKRYLGVFVAAIIVSLIFALGHLNWLVAIDTLLLSLVVIFAYEKTNNLAVAIIIHMIKNFVAFLVLFS